MTDADRARYAEGARRAAAAAAQLDSGANALAGLFDGFGLRRMARRCHAAAAGLEKLADVTPLFPDPPSPAE